EMTSIGSEAEAGAVRITHNRPAGALPHHERSSSTDLPVEVELHAEPQFQRVGPPDSLSFAALSGLCDGCATHSGGVSAPAPHPKQAGPRTTPGPGSIASRITWR